MFLSKVLIEKAVSRNPYDWHRALWRLFPDHERESRDSSDQDRQGFLFCVDRLQAEQGAIVLLQSNHKPLQEADGVALLAPSKEFIPQLATGTLLHFQLTANPVKTIRDAHNPELKKRVPLIDEKQQTEWLKRQLAIGASLSQVVITPNPPLFFSKKGAQSGKILTATFEGILQVNDVLGFQRIHRNGIGHAKAFGCGLLLVKRC